MFEFIWDAIQQEQIGDLQSTAAARQSAVSQAQSKVLSLEQRYERLRLTNMGMWELMKRKLGVTAQDLAAAVQGLVAESASKGRNSLGGRLTPCPACHRNVLSSATTCMYCGAHLAVTSSFGGT